MIATDLLTMLAPDWAKLIARSDAYWTFEATPAPPSDRAIEPVQVKIRVEEEWLRVSEWEPGSRFPESCYELHIPKVDFCLGRYKFCADDPNEVRNFWQALGEFLINADFTLRRGFWPQGRWLSHGNKAADAHAESEQAAREAGIAEEYDAWLEMGEGWMESCVAEMRAEGRRLMQGNRDCPRGCSDNDGRPIKLKRCRHRNALVRLVEAELKRQDALASFYESLRDEGRQCCGRVPGCPLAASQLHRDAA